MAQCVELVLRAITNLGQMGYAVPWQHKSWFKIVVTNNEVLTRAGQLSKDGLQIGAVLRLRSEREVANDPKIITRTYLGPEVFDERRVHMAGIAERPTG